MIEIIKTFGYEILARILLTILGIIFILLGLISPEIAYDTMTRAMDNDKDYF